MSEPTQQSQDAQHLQLLAIFHYVCAGMIALFSCFPLIYLILGLMVVFNPQSFGPGNDFPPRIFGWLFVLIPGVFILLGWIFAASLAWSGRCLQRHTRHLLCTVVACITCLFIPIGTVLGVCTLIVLMRPSVKALFNPAVPNPAAAV